MQKLKYLLQGMFGNKSAKRNILLSRAVNSLLLKGSAKEIAAIPCGIGLYLSCAAWLVCYESRKMQLGRAYEALRARSGNDLPSGSLLGADMVVYAITSMGDMMFSKVYSQEMSEEFHRRLESGFRERPEEIRKGYVEYAEGLLRDIITINYSHKLQDAERVKIAIANTVTLSRALQNEKTIRGEWMIAGQGGAFSRNKAQCEMARDLAEMYWFVTDSAAKLVGF